MDFSVQIDGLDKLKASSEQFAKAYKSELDKALYASAKQVETTAKKSIVGGSKSGRAYKRRSITHVASAPGEAPASDTGRLVNSISSYLNSGESESFVVAGRGTALYAALLEFGTRLIAARPFMFPALEQSKAWISNRLSQALSRAIESAGK